MKGLFLGSLSRFLIALILVEVPMMVAGTAVQAEPLPYNSILFADANSNTMYSINPDGSGLTSIGSGYSPRFSPDGSKIAFVGINPTADASCPSWEAGQSTVDIFVMNNNGSNLRDITPGVCQAQQPVWSPDGKKLAFENDTPDKGAYISTINLNGTGLATLQPGITPSWSPDGSKIAYQSIGDFGGIYAMNTDGSDNTELVSEGRDPNWSPDGTRLAFQDSYSPKIQVVNSDGSGLTTVYSVPSGGLIYEASNINSLSWSPDSSRIAVAMDDPGAGGAGIYAISVADGTVSGVYLGGGYQFNVEWGYTYQPPTTPMFTSADNASTGMRVSFDEAITTTGFPAAAITESGTLPSGITFTDNGDGTGDISGAAAAGTNGTYPITLTADNGVGTPATQNFTLTITADTSAPAVSSPDQATGLAGTPFNFTVTTYGFPVPALTKTGALPGGLTFTDNGDGTATIGGTLGVNAQGIYSLTITANNGVSPKATQAFNLTINRLPTVKTLATTTASVGTPFNLTIGTRGYPIPSIAVSGTPASLTFVDNGDGTGMLSGTPGPDDAGAYPVTITVTNSLGTATKTFTLKVYGAPTFFYTGSSAAFTPGVRETAQVQANGYPAPTYSISGTLPAGITFNGTSGKFTGKVTADEIGIYPLTLTATNTYGSLSIDFELDVSSPS